MNTNFFTAFSNLMKGRGSMIAIAVVLLTRLAVMGQTGTLPVMYIETENHKPITSKTVYINGTYYIVDQQNQGGIILDGTAVYDPTAVLPVSYSPAPSKAIYRLDGTTAHDATAPGLYIIDGRKVAVR